MQQVQLQRSLQLAHSKVHFFPNQPKFKWSKTHRPEVSFGPSTLSLFVDNASLPVIVREGGVERVADCAGK